MTNILWENDTELGKEQKLFQNFLFPVDTGRKLNVHKTFRRRPGRLLNVLCTFNLCPVFAGLGISKMYLKVVVIIIF